MKLPIAYKYFTNYISLIEVVAVFTDKIDKAIEALTKDKNMQVHGRNHLIQMVMFTSGMFMCTESFKDIEQYLGEENIGVLLRDFAVVKHGH